MKKKNIYIAGCGGMLGEAFYINYKDDYIIKCSDINNNDKWLHYLDFTYFNSYKNDVFDFKPDYLFHIGALTDIEFCELNPKLTYKTNTKSVQSAVFIANELSIPILYIGTVGIFDGEKIHMMNQISQSQLVIMLNQNFWVKNLLLKMQKNI